MDNLDFSEEEIQEQLEILGYKNIPKHRLHEFKKDLDELIRHGNWKGLASSPHMNTNKSPTATFQPGPPAYTKEKVSCYIDSSGEGYFLHTVKVDKDRPVLTTCQNEDYGWRPGRCDSYAQHSVAPKLRLPPGAPSRLQVESDPEDTLHPPNTDSYTSSPNTAERRFIKRKVLRKHKGKTLVCDESLYSDDLERQEEEEEEKVEQMIEEEESKAAAEAEDFLQEASEEEKPELNLQGNDNTESLEDDGERRDEDDEDKGESSRCDSPAQSLMTSGYGTYRPEEQEGGDYRDNHTITEFDQDSRADFSEMRDDEDDDRSLCSFGGFDIESDHGLDYSDTPLLSAFEDDKPEANVSYSGDTDITRIKPESGEMKFANEHHKDIDAEAEIKNVTSKRPKGQRKYDVSVAEDKFLQDGKEPGAGIDLVEGEESGSLEAEVDQKVESEDPDESSSNKDIKFFDSNVDLSWKTYKDWDGNLRQKKDAASCLEERLAELHLSTQHDSDTKNQDISDTDSSDTDGISMSAFQSYIRGMTRTQSDSDLRPKPKSFIRPVMSQQTIKKSDPVAKYFQYKQLWEMFKLPGEKDRRALRLEIKERLAFQPPPPKPRRVFMPNTYTVPTEKKRSALRWEIRNDLANGLLPHKFTYQY